MFEIKCPVNPEEYMDLHFGMLKLIQYDDIKHCKLSKNVVDLIKRLNWHCFTLTQSCMELIWPGFVWQAEILERSLLEATIKLIYIAIDKSTIDQKVDEFQNIISDINQYKRRKEMLEYLDNVDLKNDVDKHALRTVTKINVDINLNQRERKKILEKWAFNSMTKEIDKFKIEGFDKLKYFQNFYSSTSHYLHVDIDCLNLIWDRENREEKEKEAITLAHIGRELTDLYSFNAIRTSSLLRLYGVDKSVLPNYLKTKEDIINKISSLDKEWQNFYREHYLNKDI